MKFLIMSLIIGSILPTVSFAGGSSVRGGGDPCEDRIQDIGADLKSWIVKGGAAGLKLPAALTANKYADNMLSKIDSAKIQCVGPGDKDFPIQVQGTAKVCRFDKGFMKSRITCDYSKFQALNDSEQYVLVHHEYAGLAGIENPNGDESTYTISNQITAYLEDQVIKRLAVKPSATNPSSPLAFKDGFYTDDENSRCTTRVTSYRETGTVVLNRADSVDGYFCEKSKAPVIYKCDRNYICVNEWGAKLVAVGPDRLILSEAPGLAKDLNFAGSRIPVADKMVIKMYHGWDFFGGQSCTFNQTQSNKPCDALDLQDVKDAGSCKSAIRLAEVKAMQQCQKNNFSQCVVKKSNSRPVVGERVYNRVRTGCWGEVFVQGSK
jgi:hypothetical protein